MDDIRQGLQSTSDGWRSIIADSFTFENVSRLSYAIGKYFTNKKSENVQAFIGYDTRFMSEFFAEVVITQLSQLGINCKLSSHPLPTPMVSWYVFTNKLDFGINVTASHNPPYYNGIKIRMYFGGAPDKSVIRQISQLIPNNKFYRKPNCMIKNKISIWSDYVDNIKKRIDYKDIAKSKLNIVIDSMHGTTGGLLEEILKNTKVIIVPVRKNHDPLFGGVSPEPKESNLQPLIQRIKNGDYDLGIAHDGDGDRIVAIDPKIGFLSSPDLVIILAYYLSKYKGLDGAILGSVATSRRVKKLALLLNKTYYEIPIGFHHATKIMIKEKVLIAGEENGGIGIGNYLPERDGTLIAALLIELLSKNIKISEILESLNNKIGPSKFIRKDINYSKAFDTEKLLIPKNINGIRIINYSNLDGVKLYLEDNSWILVRKAKTEPLIRLYAEADTLNMCDRLIGYVCDNII